MHIKKSQNSLCIAAQTGSIVHSIIADAACAEGISLHGSTRLESTEQFLFITCRALVRAHAIIDNVDLIKPASCFFSNNEPVGDFNIHRSLYT